MKTDSHMSLDTLRQKKYVHIGQVHDNFVWNTRRRATQSGMSLSWGGQQSLIPGASENSFIHANRNGNLSPSTTLILKISSKTLSRCPTIQLWCPDIQWCLRWKFLPSKLFLQLLQVLTSLCKSNFLLFAFTYKSSWYWCNISWHATAWATNLPVTLQNSSDRLVSCPSKHIGSPVKNSSPPVDYHESINQRSWYLAYWQ